MAAVIERLSAFFWSEAFWLGKHASWKDLISTNPSVYYPRVSDMNWSIVVAFGLMAFRYVYEKVLITPLASALGVHERKQRQLAPSVPLETALTKYKELIPHTEIKKLTTATGMTERQIERWLFWKRMQLRPSALYKFKECSWHFLFYSLAFVYGMWILWDKPWLWKTVNCWISWPLQHISTDIYIFYLFELGFYWSLLLAILFSKDYQKKDKNEMILHHCITITLIYFSWACNFVRVGTLVLVVHDFADPWVAIAKMAKYSNHQTICEIFFGVFIVTWISSRCFIYPLWVLNTTALEVHDYMKPFPGYWFFNSLLFILQLLHLLWTYLILRVAFEKFQSGTVKKDSRSESEEEEEADFTTEEDEKAEDKAAIKEQQFANGAACNKLRSRPGHCDQ